MFDKEMKNKLNTELGFMDKGNKYKGYSVTPLYRAAKVKDDCINDFRVILDIKLEDMLIHSKNQSLKEQIKDNIKEIIEGDFYDVDDMVNKIEEYVKCRKLALNIARNQGFDAINKPKIMINQFAAAYCRYLGAYKQFIDLSTAKDKIIDILNKLGYEAGEKDLYEEMKFYYYKDSRKIASESILKINRDKNLYVAMLLAQNLMKRKEINLDLNDLLEITESEEESIVSDSIKIEIVQYDNQKAEADEENKNEALNCNSCEELKKQIANLEEELEIERIISSREKEKMLQEITALRKEKLENIEYAKSQYKNAMENAVKVLNDRNYGCLLDELYRYSKGYIDKINDKAIISNLLAALQSIGIRAMEKNRFNSSVILEKESVYKFRFNKGLESYEGLEAVAKSPAWFYKNKEVIKEFVEIKER